MNNTVKRFLQELIDNDADVQININGIKEVNGKEYAKYEMLMSWNAEAKAKQIRVNEREMIANAIK
jgi:hypothetical protein